MTTFRSILFSLSSVLFLASCQKQDGANLFVPTHVEGWNKIDTLCFPTYTADYEADHDLQLQARITKKFGYEELWLVVEQHYAYTRESSTEEETDTIAKEFIDTICMPLVDDNGNFNGNGRELLTYNCPIRFVHLHEGENATIRVRHIMDEKTIQGVHDIGIELVPLQSVTTGINTQEDKKQKSESPQR